MKTANALSNRISLSEEEKKIRYDESCKRVLSFKSVLANILKGCVDEFADCSIQDIQDKYIEADPEVSKVAVNPDESDKTISGMSAEDVTINEGKVLYDIRFYAIAPSTKDRIKLIINLEAQNEFKPGYSLTTRGIYYCARLISSQYGTEFVSPHYGDIKKVYSIWICMNPPSNRKNTITKYNISENHVVGNVVEDKKNYDLLTLVMVCLGSPKDENYNGILKLLGVMLSEVYSESEKKKIMSNEFGISLTNEIEEGMSDMCNLSEGVYKRGKAEGIVEGILKGKIETVKNMLKEGISLETALRFAGLDKETYEKYVDKEI
jgi:predicted transposase/invertase (TIGR01784 family)